MQQPRRNGRSRGGFPDPFGGAFGGELGEFPDPFAPLGGQLFDFPDPFAPLGGQLSDFLHNNPFASDPFFASPFGSPFGPGGLLGASGMLNETPFRQPGMIQQQPNLFGPFGSGGLFGGGGFGPGGLLGGGGVFNLGHAHHPENLLDQRPAYPRGQGEEGSRRGVHIEEILDNQEIAGNRLPNSGSRGVHIEEIRDEGQANSNGGVHIEEFRDVANSNGGVHIEELPEGHESGDHHGLMRSIQGMKVEHPADDDDEKADAFDEHVPSQPDTSYQASGASRSFANNPLASQQRSGGAMGFTRNNPGQSFSFQSSTVMYGGSNGPYYASRATRTQGADGIVEEERQEKNTVSGRESHSLMHGFGSKGLSMTRNRNAQGTVDSMRTLHNIGEEEMHDFESNWQARAERSLPKWNKSHSGHGSYQRPRPALPYSRPELPHSRSNR